MRINEKEAVALLFDAKACGRPIVPFLGAGISSGSGFPLVESLRHYLLKVKFFIQFGAFRDSLQLTRERSPYAANPEQNPSCYLTDFGWPDPNQLNSDIHRTEFGETRPDFAKTLGDAFSLVSEEALGATNSGRQTEVSKSKVDWIDYYVIKSIENSLGVPELLGELRKGKRKHDDSLVRRFASQFELYLTTTRTVGSRWGRARWRTKTAALFAQLEDTRLYDRPLAESLQEQIWSLKLSPTSDWSRHLMQLTEGNSTLIDSLASTLSLRYAPGLSHRLMAQIVRTLNLNLLLTINFDPYLEMAFAEEGITPRVIDVSRDEAPPDVSVVRQALTIVKLHGTSHSIRMGERLDYALDDDTRQRVERIVGSDALLLVIGFSGYERRMMQLIEHLTAIVGKRHLPRVLWMHFEPEDRLPATLVNFCTRLCDCGKREQLKMARLSDAGEFLFHWFQKANHAYPRARFPITILPKRILKSEANGHCWSTNSEQEKICLQAMQEEAYLHLFMESDIKAHAAEEANRTYSKPSIAMSDLAKTYSSYDLIWIDLEEHHTVAGVITEIIDRMRVFDPSLSPLVLPVETDLPSQDLKSDAKSREAKFDKAVRFLRRALRRGRYFIAFDSLEDFGREHTSHHGLPSDFPEVDGIPSRRKMRLLNRVEDLAAFLRAFLQLEESAADGSDFISVKDLDWFCGIACCSPQPRHASRSREGREQSVVARVAESLSKLTQSILNQVSTVTLEEGKSLPLRCDRPAAAIVYLTPVDNLSKISPSTQTLQRRQPGSNSSLWSETQILLNKKLSTFMLAALNAKQGQSPDWKEVDKDGDVPFFALSLARRPRSLLMIREVWSEYLMPIRSKISGSVYKTIDHWLEGLEQQERIVFMPGGFYWIHHFTHRSQYKMLTDPVRRKCITNRLAKRTAKDRGDWCNIVSRLLFLVNLHGRLARFYYLHVFQRTHDANSMFEYLYHRVTSLKYMGSLCGVLDRMSTMNLPTEEKNRISQEAALLFATEAVSVEQPEPRLGDLVAVKRLLEKVQVRWIRGLANVFEIEKETVFSLGSVDTWLAWIEQLLEHDLEQFRAASDFTSRTETNSDCDESIHHMRRLLEDLEAHLLREKRDWHTCAIKRISHLQSGCGKIAHWIECQLREKIKTAEFEELSNLCNALRKFESKSSIDAIAGLLLPNGRSDLTQFIEKIVAKTFSVEGVACNDRLLRELERLLICFLDLARAFHHDPSMKKSIAGRVEVKNAPHLLLEIACHVVAGIHNAIDHDSSRNMPLDQFGLELRSLLDIWHIRLTFEQTRLNVDALDHWQGRSLSADNEKMLWDAFAKLAATIQKTRGSHLMNPGELGIRRCELRTLQARILTYLEMYPEARNELMNAETGLNEQTLQQRFQLAIVAELRSQSYMKDADQRLRLAEDSIDPVWSPSGQEAVELIQRAYREAKGRLDDARYSLNEAERFLQRDRRSAGHWLRLYAAKAQLEFECLLLMLFNMQDESLDNSVGQELNYRAQLYNCLYRGVESVRSGWDCSPSPARWQTPEQIEFCIRERRPWLARWCQLMIVGYTVLDRYSRHSSTGSGRRQSDRPGVSRDELFDNQMRIADPERFASLWIALNESVGLERFVSTERNESVVTWKNLLQEAINWTDMKRKTENRKVCHRRSLVNRAIDIMVTKTDNPSPIRQLYENWELHRASSGLRSPAKEDPTSPS